MPKVSKKFKPVLGSRQPAQQQQQQQRGQQQHTPKAKPAKQQKRRLPPSSDYQHPFKKRAVAVSSSQTHNQWQCSSVIDQQSAEVVDKLLLAAETRRGGATIKSLTLAPHIVHKKPTFAVTCETLKHLPLLKQLVEDVGLLEQHQLMPAAAYVLVYEMLLGQGFRRKGPAEKAVLQYKERLQSGLQRALQEAAVEDVVAWLSAHQEHQQSQQQQPVVQHPRFARVNTLKGSVQQVLAQLHNSSSSSSSRIDDVKVDDLLPDLLVFPAGTDLHDHPLVTEGVLILQSKASCMPAHALQPQPGWHVVDCCAAPGNKTTHVAALLQANTAAAAAAAAAVPAVNGVPRNKHSSKKASSQQGAGSSQQQGTAGAGLQGLAGAEISAIRVYAFDKDPKRLKRLAANVGRAGAGGIVVPQRADFLTIDPLNPQFQQVKGVILDPSCSGSGTTVSRMDHLLPGSTAAAADGLLDEQEQQRVEQLAKFQEAALLHALQFPALQRLVYSTCSIHQRENEDVVAAVLPAATAAGFALVDPFPAWHRRGVPVVEGSELLVRTDAHEDGTDGFFVAVFERNTSSKVPQQPQAQQQQQQREQGHASGVLVDNKHDEQKQQKRKKKGRVQQPGQL